MFFQLALFALLPRLNSPWLLCCGCQVLNGTSVIIYNGRFCTFLPWGKFPRIFLLSTATSHHIDRSPGLWGTTTLLTSSDRKLHDLMPIQSRMSVSFLSAELNVNMWDPNNRTQTAKKTIQKQNARVEIKKSTWNIMKLLHFGECDLDIRPCSNPSWSDASPTPRQYLISNGCHLPLKSNQQHQFRSEMMWVGDQKIQKYNSHQFTTWTPVFKPLMNIVVSVSQLSSPPAPLSPSP